MSMKTDMFEDIADAIEASAIRVYGKCFGGEPVVDAKPSAVNLAAAIRDMLAATIRLDVARKTVPSYTAQWSDADYVANEQEAYNRACDKLEEAILASLKNAAQS